VVWSPSKPSFFSKSALISALVKCFDEFKSIVFAGCRRNSELTIFDPPVILNTMMKKIPRIVPAANPALTEPPCIGRCLTTLPCGGWCPKGRKAEDGSINAKYPLKESSSGSYLQRTEWNVRDSDATILFSIAPTLSGGSKKTVEFTRKHDKPWVHIHAAMPDASQRLKTFLDDNVINVLNVAGPRGSKEPKLPQFVIEMLNRVFNL